MVDSADLPLNVSRELLQQNPLLDVIQKNVVKNVLDTLAGMKNIEFDKYLAFYRGLRRRPQGGADARLGEPREDRRPAPLREREHRAGEVHDAGGVRREDAGRTQKEIYYLIGESAEQLRQSPYLEAFRAKGRDVLLLTDPIDEFAIPQLGEYKGKQLQAADRGDTTTGEAVPPADGAKFAGARRRHEGQAARGGRRAAHHPADRERRVPRRGRGGGQRSHGTADGADGPGRGGAKRVLELNPNNPAVAALRDLHARDAADPRLETFARLLFEQAVVGEGSSVSDPAAFARRVNDLIARDASGKLPE